MPQQKAVIAIYESGNLGDGGVVFSLEHGMETTWCILGKLGDDVDVISHENVECTVGFPIFWVMMRS